MQGWLSRERVFPEQGRMFWNAFLARVDRTQDYWNELIETFVETPLSPEETEAHRIANEEARAKGGKDAGKSSRKGGKDPKGS